MKGFLDPNGSGIDAVKPQHVSLDTFGAPYGSGSAPLPEFRKVLTQTEADALSADESRLNGIGGANVETTPKALVTLQRNIRNANIPERDALAKDAYALRTEMNRPELSVEDIATMQQVRKAAPNSVSWDEALEVANFMKKHEIPASEAEKGLFTSRMMKASEGMKYETAVSLDENMYLVDGDRTDAALASEIAANFVGAKQQKIDAGLSDFLAFYNANKSGTGSKLSPAVFRKRFQQLYTEIHEWGMNRDACFVSALSAA